MQSQSTILSMNKTDAKKSLLEMQLEARSHLTEAQRAILDMDFILDASQLDDKYNPDGDGEHPVYMRGEWRTAVGSQDTIVGYWDWVEYRIEQHHALA